MIDIDQLNYDDLVDLNHRIVERLRFLDQMQAHAQMLEFRIGERIAFVAEDGREITGIISKYNRKTVTIISEEGQRWRVSPKFLRKATDASATKNQKPPTTEIRCTSPRSGNDE